MVRMNLVGGDSTARALAQQPLPGVVNYLMGRDPAAWHTNMPTFGRVGYAGVYPGIDVAYHGDQGQMEYDFTVGPGAKPEAIALAFDGAKGLRLDGGELVITTPAGEMRQPAPVVYQDLGATRRPVEGHFVLRGGNQVGFALGAYDHSRPVVIDPKLAYSTFLGGSA